MSRSIALTARVQRSPHRARGQALVEYIIILPTLLLLVLGIVQFGLLYQIKSQVNYATFAAARQGALKGGSTTAIKDAFAAGMTPIFTPDNTITALLRGRAVAAIEAFNPLVTKIERVSPPDSVKDDFKEQDPTDTNSWIVPNDNLAFRSTDVGGNSQLSIQDANILKIRITYCAKLIVPIANVTFYSLVNGLNGAQGLAGEFFSSAVPITSTSSLTFNNCTRLIDRYAGAVADASGIVSSDDLSFVTSMVNSVQSILDGSIPGINWSMGGLRVPVVSEAVVRMQTPMKFKK